jgi:hypothetical protein
VEERREVGRGGKMGKWEWMGWNGRAKGKGREGKEREEKEEKGRGIWTPDVPDRSTPLGLNTSLGNRSLILNIIWRSENLSQVRRYSDLVL